VRAQLPEVPEAPPKRHGVEVAEPKLRLPAEVLPPRREPPPLPGPPPQAADPRVAAAEQIKLGKEAMVVREYGRAERRFQQAALLIPTEALDLFLLAQAQFAQGKYQEAVLAIQAGMRLQPDWPASRFRPRDLYGPLGDDMDEQLKRLNEARVRYPDDPFLLFLYAYELWFADRRDEARLLFLRARAISPDPAFSERFLMVVPPFPTMIW
jgi:tetratricopeptide (TPR) repeat protein